MHLGLEDKVIVITGGASGIGAATTRACLAEGAKVIVLSRISFGVPEFIAEMNRKGQHCSFHEVELSDVAACQRAIEQVRQEHGSLFGLVNNAGTNDGVSLEKGSPQAFLGSLTTNLVPAYTLAHFALPLLKKANGTIVNIASKVALTGQGKTSGYAASKGGLLALTREWAADLLPFGIRVNAVIPAEVMTPAYSAWLSTMKHAGEKIDQITSQIPLGHRMTTPEEIAAMVTFLLSPTQSGHTTGQQVIVDGGYVHLDRMLTAGA